MNDILLKSKELVDVIKKSDNYKRYLELTDIISKNNDVMKIISDIKLLQQKIVKYKYNNKNVLNLEKELNKKMEELENYPFYLEYSNIQKELNISLQIIKEMIENCINDITN